ncbi:MAG: hypothetical protein ACYC5K_08240 [Saccharofermentanales bacterium]
MYTFRKTNFIFTLVMLVFCFMLASFVIVGCSTGGSRSGSDDASDTSSAIMISSSIMTSDGSAESDSSVSEGDSQAASDPVIDVIRENDLIIGGIALTITQDEFLLIMTSEPVEKRINKDEYLDFTETTYIYDGIEVLFIDDACYSVVVTGSGYETLRGLAVGDSEERVLQLYGAPATEIENHWGYNYEGGADYEVFSVTITDGKVSEIKVNLTL